MDYQLYTMFDTENFVKLTNGIKIAQFMKGESSEDGNLRMEADLIKEKLGDLSISETLFCSHCNVSFEDQTQQRSHYKLDWHRYNLKQNLRGRKYVTEESFLQLSDDLSSISGSESESDLTDEEDSSETRSPVKCSSAVLQQVKNHKADVDSSSSDSEEEAVRRARLYSIQLARHSKVFFENTDGKILSIYRCLLHGKKNVPEVDDQLVSLALECASKPIWAIVMLGGGHFAAGIFHGTEVLVHKTFHSYTVRARQGGTQSSRDSRSARNHPKSAGASLRRYNEASLLQHVQDIMDQWKNHLETCSLILYRAVGHNRNVLFGGRFPPLNRMDLRLRTIPFPTRRATFSEVKRVHEVLSSIEVYGSADAFQTSFPQTPRKKLLKNTEVLEMSRNPEDGIGFGTECVKVCKDGQGLKTGQSGEETQNPKRTQFRGSIDRAKPRKSPHRPLPEIIVFLSKSSTENSDSEKEECMVHQDVEISMASVLLQYEDTVPQKVKDRKANKAKKKVIKKQAQVSTEECREAIISLRKKLLTACKMSDMDLLIHCTSQICAGDINNIAVQPSKFTSEELIKCLNESVADNGNTLLHLAAQQGNFEIIRELMRAGADPTVKNKMSQTPYVVACNKEMRNAFRKFLAEYPDKYDYSKSHIPGPLTEDMEVKRKSLKKAKKDREKERKKEVEARRQEELERERFLKLSDREKRALAAEKRMMVEATRGAGVAVTASEPVVVSRCCQCGMDITGQVPFEYDYYRFCTIKCLKQHRLNLKSSQQK